MARKKKRTLPARTKAAGPIPPPPARAKVSSGFSLHPDDLERQLLTGEARGSLEDYFGPEAYTQLRDLAHTASTRSVRGGARVLILPGIMGSTLAKPGLLGMDDVLWVDPVEIALGRLTELKLGGGASSYHANGVILFAYLKLKLRLKIAGFDADFFPFDWRLSLTSLGAALAEKIRQEPAPQLSLVAHSMGGLVARAALKAAGKKVLRFVMLGTPNYGSFAPVQAIRGTYDVVQKLARVDLGHDVESLSREVFSTFPGLYEMLPSPDKFSTVDLYKTKTWPKDGPQPQGSLLSAVQPVINRLAGADERFYLIAGVNQETVTGLRVDGEQFVYETSSDGDGTVPLEFAQLTGIPKGQTYFVEEGHGSLPNNGAVETAVIDLLSKGVTQALPTERPATRRAAGLVPESKLRQMAPRARGAGQLGSADYRNLLDAVAAPPAVDAQTAPRSAAAAAGAGGGASAAALSQSLQNVTIGRRRQRRIEITLAHGSITEADAPAYVLGVFRNVAPSGAAKAIDQRLDGAISEFTARRMFSGDLGAVFTVPVGRNRLPAGVVLFAGLGPFDQFNADVQQLVAENVIRVLVRSRIDEFATVLIGAGSGQSAGAVMQNLLIGYFRGLRDADPNQRFRGMTLCETNADRYAEMKSELYRMAATSLFDDVELTLGEAEIPPPAEAPTARVLELGPEPIYAIVRQENQGTKRLVQQVSILGSGMKAAVVTASKEIEALQLDGLLRRFDDAVGAGGTGGTTQDLLPIGKEFADLVLPAEVLAVLPQMKDRHLVVVHDTWAARIPWETLTIDDWTAAVTCGLSRRYIAEHLPIATWLEARRINRTLNLLLVVNPTEDLPGANDEGDRILALAKETSAIEVMELRHKQATRASLLSALRSGKYDCVHYAGHAFFDEQMPARSGLLCAGEEILTGSDLTGISNLPSLVFFNACEAGRVRGRKPPPAATQRAAVSAGVAEALMRGGIANFLSTYWPVADDSAKTFATNFYTKVLAGRPLGEAILAGRQELNKAKSRDWADYILYGSYDFVLKRPSTEAP
jgi:pimeloyl-ACP methyl ester carboxylesterase